MAYTSINIQTMFYHKIYLLTLFILLNRGDTFSQDKTVKYIQDFHEYMINQRVTEDYHVNEYKLNSENNNFPDEVRYTRLERYFYSYKGGAEPSLRTILIKSEKQDLKYNQEFLFDLDGNLMFFFEGQNDNQKFDYRTFELYFDKGTIIYCKEGEINVEKAMLKKNHLDKGRIVLEEAQHYLKKFTDYQLPEIKEMK